MVSEAATDAQDTLQDLMSKQEAMLAARHDPAVPEGAVIGESDIGGQMVKWKKPRSLVRNGDTPLPERFMAFDKFGNMSMLPTAMMGVMLSKPRADAPGERAFHTHSGGKTRETCGICPPEKKPIDALCPFCKGPRGIRPTFLTEYDFTTHKNRLHPEEFAAEERAIDRAERRASLEAQERLAQAILQSVKAGNAPPEKKEK